MSYLRGIRMDRGTVLAANDANGSFATASEKASMFNDAIKASYAALIFNEAGFTTANKALVFREAGLSIANINAIIIHANISDDNAQQILSEITKANRDLTSAANIYEILDDWDDNKLTGRDGAGTTSTGFTNLFAQKDKFRPVWTTVAGTPAVANGKLELDNTEQVKVASTFGVGTWEIDLTVPVQNAQPSMRLYAGAAAKYRICGWYTHSTNLWAIVYDDVDTAYVIQGAGASWDVNPHTLKTTRDGSSGWEVFFDGVSKGTATDATTTSFDELHVYAEVSASKYDNLKVY